MNQPTFAIAVRFQIHSQFVSAFTKRVVKQAQDSLTKEAGCLQFDVLLDQEDPTAIFLYETYRDSVAFEAHRATPHFADFQATIAEWVVSKQVTRLQTVYSSATKGPSA